MPKDLLVKLMKFEFRSHSGVVDINHSSTSTTMLYVDRVSVDLSLTSRVSSGHSGFLPPQKLAPSLIQYAGPHS